MKSFGREITTVYSHKILLVIGAILILTLVGTVFYLVNRPTLSSFLPNQTETTLGSVEVIAENLKIPWAIVFLPDNDMLVTERPGTIKRISNKKTYPVEGVAHIGEGGLLGLVLHPNFSENHWLYLYFTAQGNGSLKNRVERYTFDNDRLSEKTVILDNIPGASFHDGGRMIFGPDDYLYITTGDAGQTNLAQDKNSLAGKILRLKDDGSFPDDNPFGNAVYSYGHRNPQGLAFDEKGQLWASEHGPSGLILPNCCQDEINIIEKGGNYGWPDSMGNIVRSGTVGPILHSGAGVWAPAGLAFLNGSLFFGGLRGEALYEAEIIEDRKVQLITRFKGDFGRIREVMVGKDKKLYITTSNLDGRGKAQAGDDKIIRLQLTE